MSFKPTKGGARPAHELTLETEAQQVLDELWAAKLIPFEMSVGKIIKDKDGFVLNFHDSRIHHVSGALSEGESWAQMVRTAVLARVSKMSGPLKDWDKT